MVRQPVCNYMCQHTEAFLLHSLETRVSAELIPHGACQTFLVQTPGNSWMPCSGHQKEEKLSPGRNMALDISKYAGVPNPLLEPK